MIVRKETSQDVESIFNLTTEAFKPMSYSDGSEPKIINDLRNDGDLILSLVAVDHKEVIGHVAFSPITVNNIGDNWYGLGPISVLPQRQRSGIGTRLINEGFRRLTELGANGIALIGDPNYYGRFGFTGDGRLTYGDLPTNLVQWVSIKGDVPNGELKYCRAIEP
ncbi:N-acetyltransferase [bacterium]|nr:N-acetyltransferase [bacterium]